jgi:cytochrome b subunit of formate dehydrogenase
MKMKNHENKNEQFVERMNLNFRIQHMILFLSLIILAISGLALYFHDTWFGKLLIQIEGGIEARGKIHRITAIVLMLLCVYHLFYILFSEKGHSEFLRILVRIQDFKDFLLDIFYSLNLTQTHADFEKYSYREKFQYWGVITGIVIMTITGLILWFQEISMTILPKWCLDLTFVVHGNAGLIIFFVLFVWHLYDVHLSPFNFPMDWSWLTGKISLNKLKKRHYKEYLRITGEK